MEMFRRPSYRKRVILAMGFAFLGQSTAVLVINNYGPTLYKALGYGTKDQLALQCGWITVGVVFNGVGALIMVGYFHLCNVDLPISHANPRPGSSRPEAVAYSWRCRLLWLLDR
jgi:hypothetical protein